MLNLHGVLKAPIYSYEVTMRRKQTLNEEQNARQIVAKVTAHNEADAKRLAERNNPAFKAGITRRI